MTKTKNNTKKLKIPDNVSGRFVRVKYTDVGCTDGICVDYTKSDKRMSVFFGEGSLA